MPGLAKPGNKKGMVLIPEWTLAAACRCKMVGTDKHRVSFDIEEFRVAAITRLPLKAQPETSES